VNRPGTERRRLVGTLILRDATVFTGTGDLLTNTSIEITDGTITKIGSIDDQPADAVVVDAGQRFVMAGFIDGHTHLALNAPLERDEFQLEAPFLAVRAARDKLLSGVTTVRDVGAIGHIDLYLRRAIQRGEVLGPRMIAAGKLVAPTGGHVHYWAREADGVDEVRKAVREQIRAGADLVKLMVTGGAANVGENPDRMHMQPEEIEVAVLETREAGKRVVVHALAGRAIRVASELGATSVEHAKDLDDETIEILLRNGTWVVPTQAVYKRLADNIDGFPEAKSEIARRVWNEKGPGLKRAVEAGVRIGVGTDCGRHFPHADFVSEMMYLVAAGMSNEGVLIAATKGNAEMTGIEDQIGTIEVGKRGDLIVLGGNPLDDLEHARDVQVIVHGGTVINPAEVRRLGTV
jgi:imidazolonepropionase-like amidohydrolase